MVWCCQPSPPCFRAFETRARPDKAEGCKQRAKHPRDLLREMICYVRQLHQGSKMKTKGLLKMNILCDRQAILGRRLELQWLDAESCGHRNILAESRKCQQWTNSAAANVLYVLPSLNNHGQPLPPSVTAFPWQSFTKSQYLEILVQFRFQWFEWKVWSA